MNGTMDEPMDTSPGSPAREDNDMKVTTEACESASNHCENSDNKEQNNHLDSDPDQDAIEHSGNENSNDQGLEPQPSPKCDTKLDATVPEQENSNDISADNHCINSNESYPDSTASSREKTKSGDCKEQNIDNQESKPNDKNPPSKSNAEETDDSEEDSSDEGSEISAEPKAEDTVSINSDSDAEDGDETSQDGTREGKATEVEKLNDSHNGNSQDCLRLSPEIHEIVSDNDDDDCVVEEEQKPSPKVSENKVQLRRSSRSIKRKKYNDDFENGESDIEEVALEDPLTRKKPIVINDTKALVEMASKQRWKHSTQNKKAPTVVIIDTNSILSGKSSGQQGKNSNTTATSSMNTQSLYQSIVARGTTVTPVSSKANNSNSTSSGTQNAQPSILPSLTDDMFVVEAPSFIVPYVYEKPSLKPFREFVDVLGKELEEQKAKEEKERLEKEKLEKEKRDKERQEKRERGEEVEESEEEKDTVEENEKPEENQNEEEEDEKKKKKEKKKAKRNRTEDDDDSWDGESSSDSEDDVISDDDAGTTVVIKDKADIEEIKDVTDLTVDKVCSGKSDNYFDCSLGKFFVNIGLNLVQEFVQNDLLKQQNRKLYREKKSGQNTKATESSITSLKKNLEFSKENNAPYSFPQKKCEHCSFKSESMLVMAHHLETPHMKNNMYKCNYCSFEIRNPHDILYHMEAEHNVRGKLERAPAYHQCANCPFEDNGKGKLARHLIPCAKKFKPDLNLAPPVDWEPPAKIPKIARSRNNMMSPYQNAFNRSITNNVGNRPAMNIGNMMAGVSSFRPRGRSPMAVPPRGGAVQGVPILRGGVMIRNSTPSQNNGKPKSTHHPSISITPLPRQATPVLPQLPTQQSKSAFVICEICDGYIKDLEQLRNHMQWIHKVKIHPKMIYNRPPLNCQKCQFRFFTDQGLERHLLGSHGLVTSSMQEAANKGKDAGRCPVCGRVYQWKLLNHVARDHNLTLKPAHLSYKCTVCTATFGMYKQFENHVYSAHSVVAKRVMDKSKASPTTKSNDSLLKPLKINDEITIIPQPSKATAASAKDK